MKNIGTTEGLEYEGCYLELTVQYNHPAEENTFYSKDIDVRFRLRSSINIKTNEEKSKIWWKRRLPDNKEKDINIEEEIVVDKYPFRIALEIENKSKIKNGEEIIRKWLNILNLNIQESFKLLWDDKYTSLCKEQGIKPVKDVIFDDSITMPKV